MTLRHSSDLFRPSMPNPPPPKTCGQNTKRCKTIFCWSGKGRPHRTKGERATKPPPSCIPVPFPHTHHIMALPVNGLHAPILQLQPQPIRSRPFLSYTGVPVAIPSVPGSSAHSPSASLPEGTPASKTDQITGKSENLELPACSCQYHDENY